MKNKNYKKPLAEIICFDLAAVRMGIGLDSQHIDTAREAQRTKGKADVGDLDN